MTAKPSFEKRPKGDVIHRLEGVFIENGGAGARKNRIACYGKAHSPKGLKKANGLNCLIRCGSVFMKYSG